MEKRVEKLTREERRLLRRNMAAAGCVLVVTLLLAASGRRLDRVTAISPGGGAVRIRIEELEALRVMRKAALGGSDPEDGKVGQNDKARHPYYKGEGKDLSR